MNRMLRSSLLLALAGSVLLAACSDSTPTGTDRPFDRAPVLGSFFEPGSGMSVLKRTKTLDDDQSETKLVKNDSGEWLDVGNAGIKVYIPPGALGSNPNIEMDITLFAPAGDDVVWEFQPHGLQFSEPLTIWIKTDDTEASYLKDQNTPSGWINGFTGVYYQPGPGGATVLETFPVRYDDGAYLIFDIEHFSGYALGM